MVSINTESLWETEWVGGILLSPLNQTPGTGFPGDSRGALKRRTQRTRQMEMGQKY